jgi:hypothetical protein
MNLNCELLIGKNLNLKDDVVLLDNTSVGKIIKYNKETGIIKVSISDTKAIEKILNSDNKRECKYLSFNTF